jgi:HK97 family phage portal protein
MYWHPIDKGVGPIAEEKTLGTGDTAWLLNALDSSSLSDSGIRVGPVTALGDPRVLGAIQAISSDVAKVSLNFHQIKGKNTTIPRKSPFWRLVKRKPNKFMTPFEWKLYIMFSLLLDGNSYAYKEYDGSGVLRALIPINPNRVTLFEADDGALLYRLSYNGRFERNLLPTDETGIMVPAERIWHQKNLPQGSGIIGASVISLARNSIGLSLSQLKMASSIAKSGAKLSGVLRHPKRMRKGTAERVKTQWANNYEGVEKAGRTAVLEEGMEFQSISMSAADAQFIEQMKLTILDICRIFRIPPSKLMDMGRATFNNVEQENLNYVTDTLMPYFERFEDSLNTHILTDEQAVNHYFEFDTSRLLRGDTKAQVEKHVKYVQNGIMNRNETREQIGMNPYDLGEDFYMPRNMAPVQVIEAEAEEEANQEETDAGPDNGG